MCGAVLLFAVCEREAASWGKGNIGAEKGRLLQVSAVYAFKRACVTVDASADTVSPLLRIRFRIVFQFRVESCAASSAATPVTCGVAIEVPS